MKRLDYYKEQWQEFIDNIDFTDEELAIIKETIVLYNNEPYGIHIS